MEYRWSVTEANKIIHRTAVDANLWIVVGRTWYHPDEWIKSHGAVDIPIKSRPWYRYANPLTALKEGGLKIREMIRDEPDRLKVMGAHMRMEMLALAVAQYGFTPLKNQVESSPFPWPD